MQIMLITHQEKTGKGIGSKIYQLGDIPVQVFINCQVSIAGNKRHRPVKLCEDGFLRK